MQGLLRELGLPPCGDDAVKGCLAIRAELKRNPALHECIDELIENVVHQIRIDEESKFEESDDDESSLGPVDAGLALKINH